MKKLFRANRCIVRLMEQRDLPGTLEVYQQVEDFLSLGPVPKASMEMVRADIAHSKESGGVFCLIEMDGNQIGVLDFVPEIVRGKALLSLLMISQRFRHQGHGKEIVKCLESYLRRTYGTHTIESGVQVNNEPGIRFWAGCGYDIGKTPRNMGDGTVAYEMKKQIAPIP